MQIIFGTKRLGKEDGSNGAFQKYPNTPVVTLEGNRGHGKSRRFLFNELASDMLNLEKGSVQQLIFGVIVDEATQEKGVLISNANDIVDLEGMTVYKTSKNKVSFDDTKERGKAVSSSVITGDVAEFLGLSDDTAHEFELVSFTMEGVDQVEALKLVLMTEDKVEAPIGTLEEATNTLEDNEVQPAEPIDADPFVDEIGPDEVATATVNESPEWDDQPSQASEGLTRATAE